MNPNRIETLLEQRIGLDSEALGRKVVEKAVRRQMDRRGYNHLSDYVECLKKSEEAWNNLIESIVVPETWFFRNRKVFEFLVRFARHIRVPDRHGKGLRILSVPCSTGEEPFSIAMALLDAGFSKDRFHIDGVDISEDALSKARRGFYGTASFRGTDLAFRERYFEPQKDNVFEIIPRVKEKVHFKPGNVMEKRFSPGKSYDIIFCRNLLIYMTPEARDQTFHTMSRLLVEEGVLFCGHAERQAAVEWGFEPIDESGVFACRKKCQKSRNKEPRRVPETPAFDVNAAEIKHRQILKPEVLNSPQPKPSHTPKPSGKESLPKISDNANLFERARNMADHGELMTALELCEAFLADHPVHVEGHFLLGLIHEALRDEEKAEKSFNRAIYLNPDHLEALNHLAFIESGRGNERNARLLRQRARKSAEFGVHNGKS